MNFDIMKALILIVVISAVTMPFFAEPDSANRGEAVVETQNVKNTGG